jgi:hypothetical protein
MSLSVLVDLHRIRRDSAKSSRLQRHAGARSESRKQPFTFAHAAVGTAPERIDAISTEARPG